MYFWMERVYIIFCRCRASGARGPRDARPSRSGARRRGHRGSPLVKLLHPLPSYRSATTMAGSSSTVKNECAKQSALLSRDTRLSTAATPFRSARRRGHERAAATGEDDTAPAGGCCRRAVGASRAAAAAGLRTEEQQGARLVAGSHRSIGRTRGSRSSSKLFLRRLSTEGAGKAGEQGVGVPRRGGRAAAGKCCRARRGPAAATRVASIIPCCLCRLPRRCSAQLPGARTRTLEALLGLLRCPQKLTSLHTHVGSRLTARVMTPA
jgi:hypothetical protein